MAAALTRSTRGTDPTGRLPGAVELQEIRMSKLMIAGRDTRGVSTLMNRSQSMSVGKVAIYAQGHPVPVAGAVGT